MRRKAAAVGGGSAAEVRSVFSQMIATKLQTHAECIAMHSMHSIA